MLTYGLSMFDKLFAIIGFFAVIEKCLINVQYSCLIKSFFSKYKSFTKIDFFDPHFSRVSNEFKLVLEIGPIDNKAR
jgi:hypothetical protein